MKFRILCLIAIYISTLWHEVTAYKYTLCTTPTHLNACEQINRTEEINCILRKNLVDCILEIERNDTASPIFTTITGEEALLASSLTEKIAVVAEFRNVMDKENYDYSTVVLVKKHINDVKSLRGAKFCHPGLDNTDVSPYVLKQPERSALLQNAVNICLGPSKTLTERYVKSISEFFGKSCRSGVWTIANKTLDNELKRDYANLVELCDTNAYQDNHNLPFLQSLNCLLYGNGDVALTTMNTIKKSGSTIYSNIVNNFMLLCKNGSVVNVTEECIWAKQPNPILVGNINSTSDFQTEIPGLFGRFIYDNTLQLVRDNLIPMNLPEKYLAPLKEVVFPNDEFLIQIVPSTPLLESYLKDFRDLPDSKESQLCSTTISICVTTNELDKCAWLRQAALNYGVQPVLKCVTQADQSVCIFALERNEVDFAVINTDMIYLANRKNMSVIAFGEQNKKDMQRTVFVVKEAEIKSLDDVKGKKGCFSEYGDQAWLMFLILLKSRIWTDSNYYSEHLNMFLNESCMPGVQDHGHEPSELALDFKRLCGIWQGSPDSPTHFSCKPNWTNAHHGNKGALDCLEHSGDFAILTLLENLTIPDGTRVMCKNGTLANEATLNVDDDCLLSITPSNLIITRKVDAKTKDILLFLQEIDERFAVQSRTAFKIFDAFGGEKDLIFKDTTSGLELIAETQNKYVKAQMDILKTIPDMKLRDDKDKSSDSGASAMLQGTLIWMLFFSIYCNF